MYTFSHQSCVAINYTFTTAETGAILLMYFYYYYLILKFIISLPLPPIPLKEGQKNSTSIQQRFMYVCFQPVIRMSWQGN